MEDCVHQGTHRSPGRTGVTGLSEGENPERYEELLARVADAVAPADIIDWLLVKDVVAHTKTNPSCLLTFIIRDIRAGLLLAKRTHSRWSKATELPQEIDSQTLRAFGLQSDEY